MKKVLQQISALLLAVSLFAANLDIYADLSNAIRSGDSRAVAGFFGNTINMTIINQEDVYSKVQAEQKIGRAHV